jgi:hypothetical protein
VQGYIGPMSDVAVLLENGSNKGEISSDLSSRIASAVDQERVDVVFLNRANVELAYAILVDGELVYERDAST